MRLLISGLVLSVMLSNLLHDGAANAQSFADRVQDATSETLVALHEEFNVPRGDANLSGVTGFQDFLVWSEFYGQRRDNLTFAEGDVNLDGEVDLGDLAMITYNYGRGRFVPDPPSKPAKANLGLWDYQGQLAVSSAQPVEVSAFEITYDTAALTRPELRGYEREPYPFDRTVADGTAKLTWVRLGKDVTLHGDFTTNATATSTGDLIVRWIEPESYDVYELALGEGDALTGQLNKEVGVAIVPAAWDLPFDEVEDLDTLLRLHEERNIPRGETDGFLGVTARDRAGFSPNWRTSGRTFASGDLNLDGTVGLDDAAIYAANYGRTMFMPDANRLVEDPANLSLSLDALGKVRVTSDRPIELGGIELYAAGDEFREPYYTGHDPFVLHLGNTPEFYAAINPAGFPSILEGSVTLQAANLIPGTTHEVMLRWFETGSYDVFEAGPFTLSFAVDTSFGDIDGDGIVGFSDFLFITSNYRSDVSAADIPPIINRADIDGNGIVDFPDFLIVSFNFGRDVRPEAAASVPEPTFGFRWGMLIVGMLVLQSRKRSKTIR